MRLAPTTSYRWCWRQAQGKSDEGLQWSLIYTILSGCQSREYSIFHDWLPEQAAPTLLTPTHIPFPSFFLLFCHYIYYYWMTVHFFLSVITFIMDDSTYHYLVKIPIISAYNTCFNSLQGILRVRNMLEHKVY